MSLQSRLTALATAIGADIKELKAKTPTPVLTAQSILDVGIAGQIRAGRQLTATDFTSQGLSAPAGLWNLSNVNDSSGNGRTLTNKGAVTFGKGLQGLAATAAKFTGTVGQAFYIADTGAADPFRIKTGSFGCWFKTAKRGTAQILIGKWGAGSAACWIFYINSVNQLHLDYNLGAGAVGGPDGLSDICDDRWHFGVCTFDGSFIRLYVDGVLETVAGVLGVFNPGNAALNIGIGSADAGNNGATPHFGYIDEAFVTPDVLSDDQIRNLYCAKIPHTLGFSPALVTLNVRRRRRGGTFTIDDFPAQPLRLYNFTNGSLGDEGPNGVVLTNAGSLSGQGADGSAGNGFILTGIQTITSTDAGLPAGVASRSYGGWIKTSSSPSVQILVGWGLGGSGQSTLYVNLGALCTESGADVITGPFVADGLWHFAVVVEENAPFDGVKRKLYLDGRLVGTSLVLNALTLGGAAKFRIATNQMEQVDGIFVSGIALTAEEIYKLYAKGSQALAPSPKNSGDHVEAVSTTDILATFDSLESTAQIDLGVAT